MNGLLRRGTGYKFCYYSNEKGRVKRWSHDIHEAFYVWDSSYEFVKDYESVIKMETNCALVTPKEFL